MTDNLDEEVIFDALLHHFLFPSFFEVQLFSSINKRMMIMMMMMMMMIMMMIMETTRGFLEKLFKFPLFTQPCFFFPVGAVLYFFIIYHQHHFIVHF